MFVPFLEKYEICHFYFFGDDLKSYYIKNAFTNIVFEI